MRPLESSQSLQDLPIPPNAPQNTPTLSNNHLLLSSSAFYLAAPARLRDAIGARRVCLFCLVSFSPPPRRSPGRRRCVGRATRRRRRCIVSCSRRCPNDRCSYVLCNSPANPKMFPSTFPYFFLYIFKLQIKLT